MKNYCESCKADCLLRNDVIFCEDCADLITCEDYGVCMRGELVSRYECYIPREYPEIRECEDGCKPPKKEEKKDEIQTHR